MKVYCFLFKHNGEKYVDYLVWNKHRCSCSSQAACKFRILKNRRLHLERHYGKTQMFFLQARTSTIGLKWTATEHSVIQTKHKTTMHCSRACICSACNAIRTTMALSRDNCLCVSTTATLLQSMTIQAYIDFFLCVCCFEKFMCGRLRKACEQHT